MWDLSVIDSLVLIQQNVRSSQANQGRLEEPTSNAEKAAQSITMIPDMIMASFEAIPFQRPAIPWRWSAEPLMATNGHPEPAIQWLFNSHPPVL